MKVTGEATLILTDIETGVSTEKTQHNTIMQGFFSRMTSTNNIGVVQNDWSIRAYTGKTYPTRYNLSTNVLGLPVVGGVAPQGEFWPQVTTDTTAKQVVMTFKQRFNPPASTTRIIDSIAIGDGNFQSVAALDLDTPCTQTTSQVLDIVYKFYLNYDVVGSPTTNAAAVPAGIMAKFYPVGAYVPGTSTFAYGNGGYAYAYEYVGLSWNDHNINGLDSIRFPATVYHPEYTEYAVTTNVNQGSKTFAYNLQSTERIGQLYKSANMIIDEFRHLRQVDIVPDNASKVQSVYLKSAGSVASTQPYLDPSYIGTSLAQLQMQDSTYTYNGIPQMFQIDVTAGGDQTTATYKVKKRKCFGFLGNNVNSEGSLPIYSFFRSGNGYTDRPLYAFRANDGYSFGNSLRIDDRRVATFTSTGVNVIDVYTNEWKSWGATTSQILTSSDIQDLAYSQADNRLYIATTDFGLQYINLTTDTVHQMTFTLSGVNANQCYSIDTKDNGDVWAVYNGGLVKYNKAGDTWTAYNAGTTPSFVHTAINANWTVANKILVDKTSADDKIVILQNALNNLLWWSPSVLVTPVLAEGAYRTSETTRSKTQFTRTVCNLSGTDRWVTTQGQWLYTVNFGQTVTTSAVDVGGYGTCLLPTVDFNGTQCCLALSSAYTGGNPALVRKFVATGVSTVLASSMPMAGLYGVGPSFIMLMDGSGTFIVNTGYTTNQEQTVVRNCIPATVQDSWISYGWNGSAWEANHAGSKPVNTVYQEVFDGLNARFAVTGSVNDFINGDRWVGYLYDGLHKDNTTSATFNVFGNVRNGEVVTSLSSTTVPATGLGLTTAELNYNTLARDAYVFNARGTAGGISGDLLLSGVQTLSPLSECEFSDDFTLSFKATPSVIGPSTQVQFGVFPTSSNRTWGYGFNLMNQNYTVYTDVTSYITSVAATAFTAATAVFTIERVGTNLMFKVNGTTVHTYTNVTGNMRSTIGFYYESCRTITDMTMTYNETRPVVFIGDNIGQTGRFDPDFAMIEAIATSPRTTKVTLNGVAAEVVTDDTIPLVAGRVLLLPKAGWLVFHPDDAGKTITCEAMVLKQI